MRARNNTQMPEAFAAKREISDTSTLVKESGDLKISFVEFILILSTMVTETTS